MATVSSSVKKYVEQNDVESTRTALTTIGYIADYDSFESFETSTDYAKERIESLFQKDDEQSYDTSMTVDAYKKIIKLMMTNFSEEKYVSVVKIGSSVFAKKSDVAPDDEEKSKEGVPVSESFFTRLLQKPMRLVIAIIVIIALIAVLINLLK